MAFAARAIRALPAGARALLTSLRVCPTLTVALQVAIAPAAVASEVKLLSERHGGQWCLCLSQIGSRVFGEGYELLHRNNAVMLSQSMLQIS